MLKSFHTKETSRYLLSAEHFKFSLFESRILFVYLEVTVRVTDLNGYYFLINTVYLASSHCVTNGIYSVGWNIKLKVNLSIFTKLNM